MPGAYLKAFTWPGVLYAWKWIDSEGDTILDWIADRADTRFRQDYYVDRTTSTRRLRWQYYADVHDPINATTTLTATGTRDSIVLTESAYYYSAYAGPDDLAVASVDDLGGGWWVADKYGRPHNLNDLLADGS